MSITPAQERVLELLKEGLTQKEIAERLFLSINTVKTHLTAIYNRLGVRSAQEAIVKCLGGDPLPLTREETLLKEILYELREIKEMARPPTTDSSSGFNAVVFRPSQSRSPGL